MKGFAWIIGTVLGLSVIGAIIGGSSNSTSSASSPALAAASAEALAPTNGKVSAKSLTPRQIAESKHAMIEARKSYAKHLDQSFLDSGIESTTKATGPAFTTLVITDALCGRVRANELGKDLQWGELHSLGFKKVIYTNGFDDEIGESFSWRVQ